MLEDMFKVIVERPRCGAGFRVNRSRLAGEDDKLKRKVVWPGERHAYGKQQLSAARLAEYRLINILD